MTSQANAFKSPFTGGGPITGRRVFMWLVAFFGVIFAVNMAFVYFALDSWPGLTTKSAYEEGLAYNKTLDQAAQQDALGWQSRVVLSASTPRGRVLDVTLMGPEGPLHSLTVNALLRRPLGEGRETTVILDGEGAGRYVALLRLPVPGRWQVLLTARDGSGRTYRMAHEVIAGGGRVDGVGAGGTK